MKARSIGRSFSRWLFFSGILFVFPFPGVSAQNTMMSKKFSFGRSAKGYTQVSETNVYNKNAGFGFEPGAKIVCGKYPKSKFVFSDSCGSKDPFYFSVALPEGNYKVTVTAGSPESAVDITVKAELRRLMLENITAAAGKFTKQTFIVNVRTPQISPGEKSSQVSLKDREKTMEWWAWDEKLTLEFNGSSPGINALEIEKIDNVPTVFLLGDSTVCDQPREPYSSWGQMLTRFFTSRVAIANHAESGEALRSSFNAKRLEKVLAVIRRGDYVFIQFGHNDEKERGDGIGAFTSYLTDLKKYIRLIREKAGIPVLITPVQRRTFDAGGKITNSHGDYPEAVRRAAKEENVPLIDLHKMSTAFYEALGPEKSKLAFKDGDGTHHNNYGAYQLAKCIVQGIRENKLGLAKYLVKGLPIFDPGRPDPLESFSLPASPLVTETKPPGN